MDVFFQNPQKRHATIPTPGHWLMKTILHQFFHRLLGGQLTGQMRQISMFLQRSFLEISRRKQDDDEPLLVGGFNPAEKYARQIGNLPQLGVKIKNI